MFLQLFLISIGFRSLSHRSGSVMEHGCEGQCEWVNVSGCVHVWECKSTCEHKWATVWVHVIKPSWDCSEGLVKAYIHVYIGAMLNTSALNRISERPLFWPARMSVDACWLNIASAFMVWESPQCVSDTPPLSPWEAFCRLWFWWNYVTGVLFFSPLFLSFWQILALLICSQLCKYCVKDKSNSQLGDIIHMGKTQL